MDSIKKVIWVTGAGRSGTNLIGMMADSHPHLNVFPYELRMIAHWLEASEWASQDGGRSLPGALLDELLIYPHLNKQRFKKLGITESQFASSRKRTYTFFEYIHRLNSIIYLKPENTFLFRAPGSQIDVFLNKAREDGVENAHVLLILRQPVQNYLSLLNHDLQKGLGYRNETVTRPSLGLNSILHVSLLRILRAFQAANQFRSDPRVKITNLETFSAEKDERQSVWQELGIPFTETLEELTRVGAFEFSNSGKWKTTEIQTVTTSDYPQRLCRSEYYIFEKYKYLFDPFYSKVLDDVDIVNDDFADKLLIERELESLTTNQYAKDKRKERMDSIYEWPKSFGQLLGWPARAFRGVWDDVLFYPRARISRMNQTHKGLLDGLIELPEKFYVSRAQHRPVVESI